MLPTQVQVEGLALCHLFRLLVIGLGGLGRGTPRLREHLCRERVFPVPSVGGLLDLLGTRTCQGNHNKGARVGSFEGALKGGGRWLGDGFRPPSRRGLVLKLD